MSPGAKTAAGHAASSYDEVPYPSFPFPQAHPDRLATIATLFGLNPPPIERARVLELGCAAAGNLIPFAEAHRESWCVGVDASQRQIADGLEIVTAAGLQNIELRHASILEVTPEWGTFDYIICHGVFSWVSETTRSKILTICREQLRPEGVAYVSYNVRPGWGMRGMLRDMMCYHAERFSDAPKRTEQARALLDFLAHAAPDQQGPYGMLLQRELKELRNKPDSYLLHEFLEEHNASFYFHEFIAMAEGHGLQFLGEARLASMSAANHPDEVRATLERITTTAIQQEQYLDFLRNRQFRETLLCHAECRISRAVTPASLGNLRVAAPLEEPATPVDCTNTASAEFVVADGRRLSSSNRLAKAAYLRLARSWPGNVPFSELARSAAQAALGGTEPTETQLETAWETLGGRVLRLISGTDLLRLETAAPKVAAEVSARPQASRLARVQASRQEWCASRRHEPARLTAEERFLVPLLDGTRDRAALVEALGRGGFHSDPGRLEVILRRLWRAAVLVG